MKKKVIASLAAAMVLGVAGTSFAAANPFSDVPVKHWSYGAVTQLVNNGILEGYGDHSFRGDQPISRYEMAIIVAKAMSKLDQADANNKAIIDKLSLEYAAELTKLDVKYDRLEKKVDSLKWSGFVRAKYDSDSSNGVNNGGGNKHYFLALEGSGKVNDNWTGHWASETRHEYTTSGWGGVNPPDNNAGDGTWFRIWADGKIGDVGVTGGRKWFGFTDNVVWGHEATGLWLDLPTGQLKTTAFVAKPTQGNGAMTLKDATNTSIYGVNFNGDISKNVNINLLVGGNKKNNLVTTTAGHWDISQNPSVWVPASSTTTTQQMSSWGGLTVTTKIAQDFKLTTTYARTNANDFNTSQHVRLDYKGYDANVPGSYGIYARYFKFGANGDPSHDDEWDSLRTDSKGWILGVDYALGKNIQWSTFYSDQKLNTSGTTGATKDLSRKLIRTSVDLHF
ncbi:S-layer homology domain-containing protein [Pelosinus sp. sgz500959]|uniref:S-layer homology domain-containing protein n=1 Tax=Pelosinus sp. sgz500959 TaxID=3242472 RepID=UPI00366F4CEC